MRTSCNTIMIALALLCLLPQESFAGSGSITPAPPNPHGIIGLINFTVNFRSPPVQAQLDILEAGLLAANDIICDVTDGQLVFGTITVTAGSVNESLADMWIFPQNGRAGLSLYIDGSSLTREGNHITMFNNSINGVVIAHEMAHLAFGILDEYSEQCRGGGPCGIGRCLENAILDAQNSSLMQQTPDATEFCVASNHDLLLGDGTGCPATSTCTNPGMCMDAILCGGYNGSTNRFELSQQTYYHGDSGWETLVRNMSNTYGLTLTAPADLPVAAQPGNCDFFIDINFEVDGTDLVVLTLDNSGSMRTRDVGDRTRLEFTQAAARAFVDLQQSNGINVGIASFNSDADVVRAIEPLTFANVGGFRDDINTITAGGLTSIGAGLAESLIQIEIETNVLEAMGEMASNPTIFLLSDGENTAGPDPRGIAELVIDRGITIHTISAGDGADTDLLSDIASSSGGTMIPAHTDDFIPPAYAEFAARHQGMSMINVIDIEQTTSTIPGTEFGPIIAVYQITFLVEEGADAITLFRSLKGEFTRTVGIGTDTQQVPFDPALGVFNYLGYFRTPEGFAFIPNAATIVDPLDFYEIINITNPTPGVWSYFVERDITNGDEKFHFRGFVDNAEPDYYIDAFPRIVNTTDTFIRISANATYDGPLFDPAITYEGYVQRPDGSRIDITFATDPLLQNTTADFSNFNGRGMYKVFSEVNVPAGANQRSGEIIFDGPDSSNPAIENFARIATASFFVNLPGCPPCINEEDCDNDGIPNDIENQYDETDNDGLPNRCDDDSDGDDIPDDLEDLNEDENNNGIPDPFDPAPEDFACTPPNGIEINVVSLENPDCGDNNGRIELSTVGGEGTITYTWPHDLTLNSNVADNLGQTEYLVRAQDEAGCSDIKRISLDIDCVADVIGTVSCPESVPMDCEFPVRVTVDISGVPAPDNALGSFTAILSWDPTQLSFIGPSTILSNYNGFINADPVNGTLIFNGANANGNVGVVDLFETHFQAIGPVGSTVLVNIDFTAMAAAQTFNSLLPELIIEECTFEIIPAGLLGDVNGDGIVNSTDGNILLSHDANLPLPAAIQERIEAGFGDVNTDGNTNSVDALIVLTFDAQFPVPYPIGEPFCPTIGRSDEFGVIDYQAPEEVKILWTLDDHKDGLKVPVFIDMSAGNEDLGSYKLEISWDSEALNLIDVNGGSSNFFSHPRINRSKISEGKLILANANPQGENGILNIANLQFERLNTNVPTSLQFIATSMATAKTFQELRPVVERMNSEVAHDALSNIFVVYPNPFDKALTINYHLFSNAKVDIQIFNLMGQLVENLVQADQGAGDYTLVWQPNTENGSGFVRPTSAGIYIIRAKLGKDIMVEKVIFAGH